MLSVYLLVQPNNYNFFSKVFNVQVELWSKVRLQVLPDIVTVRRRVSKKILLFPFFVAQQRKVVARSGQAFSWVLRKVQSFVLSEFFLGTVRVQLC